MKSISNQLVNEIINQVPILIKHIDPMEIDLKVLNAKRRCENSVRKLKNIK